MVFVQIEGSLDELRGLTKLPGLELSRGVRDLGGGRWRAGGVVHDNAALDVIRARGLTVTVTLDESEVDSRIKAERDNMKAARPDGGAAGDGGRDGGGGGADDR